MGDDRISCDPAKGTSIKVHDSSKAITLILEVPSGCTVAQLKQEISEKHPDSPAIAAQRVRFDVGISTTSHQTTRLQSSTF
jgi:hypothetical protein